jgi:VIT1/CCC1 family predicted Fe2+/Mn2+ transporter
VSVAETPGELSAQKRALERKIRAREFVFGIQDGLLSTVGLLSGVSAATANRGIVLLTGVAAAITGGVSMATGSYLAARTEQEIFEKELLDQQRLAAAQPHLAQEALLESLVAEGLDRPSAYRVVQLFSRDRDLLLRTVQEKVLGIGSADISQPLKAGLVMFLSFVVGAAIPLTPLVLVGGRAALPFSWALSILVLLAVGVMKGILTGRPRLRSGLEFAAVALGSALAGWLVGTLFERTFGIPVP